MRRLPSRLALAVALLGFASLLPTSLLPAHAQEAPATPGHLVRAIDAVLDDSAFANAFWGAAVVDLERGRTLYARNAGKAFVPASNTKLYTTAAALDQLGPTYTFKTEFFHDGTVRDGVLDGNLIVRGSGDPVIGGRFNDGDLTEAFRAVAADLQRMGVRAITGDVIGDDDLFDDVPLGSGWSWDDEPFWYSAEISALSFNDNCVDFEIEAQRPGMPGLVRWEPAQTNYVQVRNASRTVAAGEDLDEGYTREREGNAFVLFSEVPQGRTDVESLSVHNPTLYFAHVLRETLLAEGIAVEGQAVDVDDLSIKPPARDLTPVSAHVSPPLAEIASVLNKRSQNLYAELTLRTLGAVRPPDSLEAYDIVPGSAEAGVEAAMRTFAAAGVDTSRIQLVDGSGLSRHNLVTPEATAALLAYMHRHPDAAIRNAFLASLPIAGVDGTLEYRMTYGPAHRNVRAKTGTLSNASALGGYVTSAAGTPLAFVLMSNHYTVPTREVRGAQDAIADLLARYLR